METMENQKLKAKLPVLEQLSKSNPKKTKNGEKENGHQKWGSEPT